MDFEAFQRLISPAGQQALQDASRLLPQEEEFLQHYTHLSRKYPHDLARAALEIAVLRWEAAGKFPFADRLYFTREALEQASAWEVSTHRAERFHPFGFLVDLGCSLGGDTLALGRVAPTLGIDHDPLRLAMAHENTRILGLESKIAFACADLFSPLPLSPDPFSTALFFDPGRRAAGRRLFSVEDYQPPLSLIRDWMGRFPALGVKISPGVNLDELRDYDAEVEFVSLRGGLKEAVLWFGPLKTVSHRATILPGPYTLIAETHAQIPLDEPRAFLYEPDPAVLRAGLVTTLGVQLEAAQIDPDIAYLTAGQYKPTPFARAWAVEDWLPFGLKRLRAYLRKRGVGRVVVKKRGSPLQPEALIRDLRLKGEAERVIFLTHLRGRPIVIVAREAATI